MVIITWRFQWREVLRRIKDSITWKMEQAGLTMQSLSYNEHMNQNYFIDCLLEPIFWIVNNYSSCLGKVFVFVVTVLTAAVVIVSYWVGLPYWWERNSFITVLLVIFGNWLLLNIVFHYFMAVVTPPGYPPAGFQVEHAASICKKCINPRPPRTHHCSVCDRCILGMDHHCPWLNNCVGFFNRRYFFLYMVYMVIGMTFVMIAGFDIGYSVLWLNDTGGIIPNNDPDLIGHPVRLNQTGALVPVNVIVEYDSINSPREHDLPVPPITEAQRICAHPWKKKAVLFTAATTLTGTLALIILLIMHGRFISRGETCIETNTNASSRKKDKKFRNPYNFGREKNWKLFLGLTQGRTFWRHVLLPSRHLPNGDGVSWHQVCDSIEDWP